MTYRQHDRNKFVTRNTCKKVRDEIDMRTENMV